MASCCLWTQPASRPMRPVGRLCGAFLTLAAGYDREAVFLNPFADAWAPRTASVPRGAYPSMTEQVAPMWRVLREGDRLRGLASRWVRYRAACGEARASMRRHVLRLFRRSPRFTDRDVKPRDFPTACPMRARKPDVGQRRRGRHLTAQACMMDTVDAK
jgi:hypothetical protein